MSLAEATPPQTTIDWDALDAGKYANEDAAVPMLLARAPLNAAERAAVRDEAEAVRIMGEQFVLGRNIQAALKRAARDEYMCSFDMLGEGARTAADAERYERAYAAAIESVGKASGGGGPETGHGISVKLSAL